MDAKLYINGQWLETKSGKVVDNVSPFDHSVVGKIHLAGADEVDAAIATAYAAQPAWAALLPSERELYLLKAADYMEQNTEKFANWIIEESGSGFMKSFDEVGQTVNIIRAAAGECRRVNGGVVPVDTPNQVSTYLRQPLGVITGIAPFNYPLLLAVTKVVLAMAAGNAFILKPSTSTPLSGVIIAECFDAVGVPAGVFNLVHGSGGLVGDAFCSDKRVKMVTFTGSTAVGRSLIEKCSKHLKRCTLEMGGKNPLLVLKDFDLDRAVSIAAFGAYFHSGQICMGTSRIIVEEPIYDAFVEKFVAKSKTIVTGDPHNIPTVIGPLINDDQYKVLDEHIRDATEKGARLLCGGKHEGNIYEASVLADVTPDMKIWHEESFGPLVSIIKAKDAEDALAQANNSDYGLSSAILTNDLSLAMDLSARMEAGMVHINESTVCGSRQAPFGGVKNSGVGREGSFFSIEEYTELKWVTYQLKPGGYPTD